MSEDIQAVSTPQMPAPLRGRWPWRWFSCVATILVLASAGVGYHWWNVPRGLTELVQVLNYERSISQRTFSAVVAFQFSDTSRVGGLQSLRLTSQPVVTLDSRQSLKLHSQVEIEAKLLANAPLSLVFASPLKAVVDVRSSNATQTLYVKPLALPQAIGIDLAPAQGIWLQFDRSFLSSLMGQYAERSQSPGSSTSWVSLLGQLRALEVRQQPDELFGESLRTHHYTIPITSQMIDQVIRILDLEEQSRSWKLESIRNAKLDVWVAPETQRFERLRIESQYASEHIQGSVVAQFDAAPVQEETIIDPTNALNGQSILLPILTPPVQPVVQPPVVEFPVAQDLDADHDGLSHSQEVKFGTNPYMSDTDGDTIIDGDEVTVYRTNPLRADSDGDGLSDGQEVFRWKTKPLVKDSDADGYTDTEEIRNGYNPLGPGKLPPQ